MSRTSFHMQVLVILLVGSSCEQTGDGDPVDGASTSMSTVATSSSGQEATSSGQPAGSTGSSSTSTTTGDESTGSLDPEVVCRTAPDPALCPHGFDIGLPAPQGCVPIDVYFYDSPDACDVKFETRCEVVASSITGGPRICSAETYGNAWFRTLDDGRIEFWGNYSGPNPPLEPGFTRCTDQLECACGCDLIQSE